MFVMVLQMDSCPVLHEPGMHGHLPWAGPPKSSRMVMCWQQPQKRKALVGE